MPRYSYEKLFISTYPEIIHFNPQDAHVLRSAVERLRRCEQKQFTKLVVEVTIKPGHWTIVAPASLKLADIEGHTPAEVWEMFDVQIDKQVEYWTRRAGSEVRI